MKNDISLHGILLDLIFDKSCQIFFAKYWILDSGFPEKPDLEFFVQKPLPDKDRANKKVV